MGAETYYWSLTKWKVLLCSDQYFSGAELSFLDYSRHRRNFPVSKLGTVEVRRTDSAELTVTTHSIVKRFNVIECVRTAHVQVFVDSPTDTFFFQAAEKGSRPSSPMVPVERRGAND